MHFVYTGQVTTFRMTFLSKLSFYFFETSSSPFLYRPIPDILVETFFINNELTHPRR